MNFSDEQKNAGQEIPYYFDGLDSFFSISNLRFTKSSSVFISLPLGRTVCRIVWVLPGKDVSYVKINNRSIIFFDYYLLRTWQFLISCMAYGILLPGDWLQS